jgi:exodeoxyribonuclease V beta subunit
MLIDEFDAALTPLPTGVSLIEANAGTGKTFTIVMLILRLVVEKNISIDKILVVTFTKAATEELKDRIRRKLHAAKNHMSGHEDASDPCLTSWLAHVPLEAADILIRLNLALLDIDRAAVFTIHGFSQRMLSEHTLASGQLFDAELTENLTSIIQACTDDFWRQEIQSRPINEASLLSHEINNPDTLLASIKPVQSHVEIIPEQQDLNQLFKRFQALKLACSQQIHKIVSALTPHIESKLFVSEYKVAFTERSQTLSVWLTGDSATVPDTHSLTLLTTATIYSALNGQQFRTTKTQCSDDRKIEFIDSLHIDLSAFDQLSTIAKRITLEFKRRFLCYLQPAIESRLQEENRWSFDSLIVQLSRALAHDQSNQLRDEIRKRFSAALIDEFQDTDDDQWQIFSRLFAVATHYLILVGDPKQAIYKFRGADIYSYLNAQRQANHRYTLSRNFRSQPSLITAVNRVFAKDNAFLLPEINFQPSQAALAENEGYLTHSDERLPPLVLWQLAKSDSQSGYWSSGKATDLIKNNVVNEIVRLLSDKVMLMPDKRPLNPSDIAILVRTNAQAREFQQHLHAANVASVLTSTESVFASQEAFDLYTLLEAVANPDNRALLKKALALDWFGNDGQSLYLLFNNDSKMDSLAERFSAYHQLWQEQGLMAMANNLLAAEKINHTISHTPSAERRLTNLQHCIELVQQAALNGHLGSHKTLSWLKNAMLNTAHTSVAQDSQQLRLESDADAVKIVTMHRAKGLEFSVVFCPFLWQSTTANNKNYIICHLVDDARLNTRTLIDLGSTDFERHALQAEFEEQAEQIRLAYVALTRAKVVCYVAWADVRSEKKANSSALSWLLNLSGHDFEFQQQQLQKLSLAEPHCFSYRLLGQTIVELIRYQGYRLPAKLSVKQRTRTLSTDWQMSSYTALSGLSQHEAHELPRDKADELEIKPNAPVSEALPLGADSGNMIHELLETVAFSDLAAKTDISEQRAKVCQRYGLNLKEPEIVEQMLFDCVTTPLDEQDSNFCLKNIADKSCLKEMPFYLALKPIHTRNINQILMNDPTFQPLSKKTINGMLTGFIDLICEYNHKFYVMDYKTNYLTDYAMPQLIQAMRQHNYGLQYWLYSLVLHRYLKARIDNYAYDKHFGGVRYLFIRGMHPNKSMQGVYKARPDIKQLDALGALFE